MDGPLFAEEARKRQISGLKQGSVSPVSTGRDERAERRAVDHAAESVGVGATTVFKVARIKREHPERIKEIEDGHKTANSVHIELFEKVTRELGAGRMPLQPLTQGRIDAPLPAIAARSKAADDISG
jgi:hypothetical protein